MHLSHEETSNWRRLIVHHYILFRICVWSRPQIKRHTHVFLLKHFKPERLEIEMNIRVKIIWICTWILKYWPEFVEIHEVVFKLYLEHFPSQCSSDFSTFWLLNLVLSFVVFQHTGIECYWKQHVLSIFDGQIIINHLKMGHVIPFLIQCHCCWWPGILQQDCARHLWWTSCVPMWGKLHIHYICNML